MKLPIQALGLIPATLAALLVDFDAARGDDPKVLDLRNLGAARDEKRSDNAADLYIKLDKDSSGTPAAHFHRQKGNIRAEYHALNRQTQADKTYWIGYDISVAKIQKSLMIWQLYVLAYLPVIALPPFPQKGTEYAGFVLSCDQAKEEIEYVAVQRYTKFLEQFKKTFKDKTEYEPEMEDADVAGGCEAMRSLTVTLSYAAPLGTAGTSSYQLIQKTFNTLYPLFTLRLDKLRIHFLPSTFTTNANIHGRMHQILRNISKTIEYTNTPPVIQDTALGKFLFWSSSQNPYLKSGMTQSGTPLARVNCKAISLSWDLRSQTDKETPPVLRGIRFVRPVASLGLLETDSFA